MTYIPNTRQRFLTSLYKNTKGSTEPTSKRNAYWEGYLSEDDCRKVLSYDYAEDTVDNLFHNLNIYEDALYAAGLVNDEDEISSLDEDIVYSDKPLESYSEEELKCFSPITKVAKAFREIMLDWMENERDELVVSLLENAKGGDYDECARKADEEGYENAVLRSYSEDMKEELQIE